MATSFVDLTPTRLKICLRYRVFVIIRMLIRKSWCECSWNTCDERCDEQEQDFLDMHSIQCVTILSCGIFTSWSLLTCSVSVHRRDVTRRCLPLNFQRHRVRWQLPPPSGNLTTTYLLRIMAHGFSIKRATITKDWPKSMHQCMTVTTSE